MSRMGLTGVHALPMNRRWVDIHRRAMPLAGLDPQLAGLKIVQIVGFALQPGGLGAVSHAVCAMGERAGAGSDCDHGRFDHRRLSIRSSRGDDFVAS